MRAGRRCKNSKHVRSRCGRFFEPLEGRALLSTISGTVFSDRNSDGVQNNGEPGLSGVTIYLDANNNGVLDAGEATTTSGTGGAYSFTANTLRTYDIAQVLPAGFAQTKPVGNIVATQNVDISRTAGNQWESLVAIDPTNPNRMFEVSIIDGGNALEGATSTDGGGTWTRRRMADGTDGLPRVSYDPVVAWDKFGNLFLAYMSNDGTAIILNRSIDGGQSFVNIAVLGSTSIDYPMLAVGPGQNGVGASVWVAWNQPVGGSDLLKLSGASVSGLGATGSFATLATVPSGFGSYGDLAVGPQGQVMISYQQTGTGQSPSQVYFNVDPDGLGPQALSQRATILTTNVGDLDSIPAQSRRTIDAGVGLAWDRSGGAHNGRVYLVYADETPDESNNTDIFTRYSDNNGATWSAAVKVNDDVTTRSQFLPRIAIDQTTGNLAATWLDARNDDGLHGAGDTDGIANNDAQVFAAVSTDWGQSYSVNLQISAGTSSAAALASPFDYGDYMGLAFQSGKFFPAWPDNSNSTANNPDGALHQFDISTARVNVLAAGTPGRYSVVANAAQGASNLNFGDHDIVAPTVGVAAVVPNPRTTPVNSVTITFSEPVTNFDLSHLQLTRNGATVSLASATLNASDNASYVLGNLQSLTSTAGAYVLTVMTSGTATVRDLSGNALAGGASTSFTVNSTVADRHLFYNNSYWDDPGNGFDDDDAIDPTKTALTNGGTGSFANYSGSSLGINGIMVDIAGLPAGNPSASDVTFKIGNDNNPSGWSNNVPAPTITVRRGMGTGGSDRVELIWSDNAIQNTWLQVAVKADAATGLASPDVFYFGNQIGETGNDPSNTFVDAGDFVAVRDHPANFLNRAQPGNAYDFNHDSFVDGADLVITRDNPNSFLTAIKFITPTGASPVASASRVSTVITGSAADAAVMYTPPPPRKRPIPPSPVRRVWD